MSKKRNNKMNVSKAGGLRDNKGKPRISLVPACLEEAVAEVIYASSVEGGGKYPMHNWRLANTWTTPGDSAMRHLKAFLQKGEDLDSQSGLNHIKHAATNLAILLYYMENYPEMDDRFKPGKKSERKTR